MRWGNLISQKTVATQYELLTRAKPPAGFAEYIVVVPFAYASSKVLFRSLDPEFIPFWIYCFQIIHPHSPKQWQCRLHAVWTA